MKRRLAAPRSEAPFLRKSEIAAEAAVLLAEYGQQHGELTAPPVPIDNIIELHLGLTFEVKDMRQLFQVADVHGALWIKDRIVGVDQSLDPSLFPNKRGRYHFTLAHETGHWRLHRNHYLRCAAQGQLFEAPDKPAYVCRSGDSKKPIEWQADFFGANLLMPRPMVVSAWEVWRGGPRAVALDDIRDPQVARANGCSDEEIMEDFCRPLAEQFQVSGQAMRIRLEELELLLREKRNTLF